MRIRALFFASYRDIAGTDELSVSLPAGASVRDLVDHLRGAAEMSALPREPVAAVNASYGPLSTRLAEGDEVALIPPVAGG